MVTMIIQISIYIFIAILLGYFFGWLTTKTFLKQRYQDKLDTFISTNKSVEVEELNNLKAEVFKYKKENKLLKSESQKALSGYEGQKHVLDEHNEVLDQFQQRLLIKDEVIEMLTSKLSLAEEKEIKLRKQYEEEIDIFMFERIEITEKYKKLLAKQESYRRHKNMLSPNTSWFSKLFAIPLKWIRSLKVQVY